ncbi:hypothetical protein SAMN05216417_101228 [Nitrosospira multiformis]|uniref:Uncharacterized protein n=1 Tax=Nitrosospira multiformis TaxID=1231 RepID=A0A1I7F8E0_9PROT|nr:hypothetical protein SAMN05216417_101228 [Nitrosospira multiformis]
MRAVRAAVARATSAIIVGRRPAYTSTMEIKRIKRGTILLDRSSQDGDTAYL